jgi:D-alanyl-D-alanine carboxypeptidase
MRTVLTALALAAIGSAALAQSSLRDELEAAAQRAVEAGAPGVIVHVEQADQVYSITRGVADRRSDEVIRPDDMIRMASVTKLYTAAVIVGLAQAGLIEFDAPVAQYLPAQTIADIANADRATVRQLLTHTSGIADYYDWRSTLFWDWTEPLTPQRVLAHVRGKPPTGEAGASYSYSNVNYHLLALAAEQVTGMDMEQLYQDLLLGPVSLSETRYNGLFTPQDRIHGQGSELWPWADTYHWQENTGPDGGMVAPAEEIAAFLQALFTPDGALGDIGAVMLSGLVEVEPRNSYGLGADILETSAAGRLIGHTGSVWGYQTAAYYVPAHDATVVVHINRNKTSILSDLFKETVIAVVRAGNS